LRMKIAQLPLLTAIGILFSAAGQLSAASVTYYYNSLDSNPYDFMGTITLPTYFPNAPLPFLSFSMSAVVNGETLSFTAVDQTGSSEAEYDTNPNDPLTILSEPTYSINDPVLGGQELQLGPLTPVASSLGAPLIMDVPSSPVIIDASDNGVWLLTAPPPSNSNTAPEASTATLFSLAITALCGFTRFGRRAAKFGRN
jgi:hypothetical protein